ncbi:MAG: putative nucleic acid-binding protein [Candidatus Woesearchaeota archaeon]|jgi:predicted nucleic acid-binding protein
MLIKTNVSAQHQSAKIAGVENKISLGDALHAILARDNNCILVTRDKHFQKITPICIPYKPEEII